MKKLYLFIFILFLALPVLAQLERGQVFLKNGTVLKGEYQYENDKLKIVSAGNIWIFDREEVDTVLNSRAARRVEIAESLIDNRVFFRSEFGLLIGNSQNNQSAPFSFTSSLNYQVSDEFSVGGGLGIELLQESYLPVFLNLEYTIRNTYSTPYFFLMAGYQVPIEESRRVGYDYYPPWSSIWPGPGYTDEPLDAKGGILVQPGIGYTHFFSTDFGLSLAFGYRFHRLNYHGEDEYQLEVDYSRLSLKLGILFK